MGATYDLSTPIGKVRLRIPDTDTSKAMFEDEELQIFLDDYEDEDDDKAVLLAAAEALETIAGDPQRLRYWSRSSVSVGRTATEDIWRRIHKLRSRAGRGVVTGTVERSDFW